ncbi:MAG: serine/threonine-protein kinase [Pseudanabaenaceae cyanobacterium bins.68]|nr:serine/threonine-protein kinase [Pseudanabaenaceae cyanobacterium bins.68]
MSYCFNPSCANPINPNNVTHCQGCGSPLLLRNRYLAIKPLGKGGFGRTFLAVDLDMPSKLRCVIKQFLPREQSAISLEKSVSLFKQEALLLERLGRHMQIPTLFGYFQADKLLYLVQEFVDGLDLAKEVKNEGPFNQEKILDLLTNLLPVLKFIHDQGVIHRDVKPANILRRSDGQLVLIDFGAAKQKNDDTATGTMIGSLEYVAPEQQMGRAGNSSDLYSLGVTCLALATAQPPSKLKDTFNDVWCWQSNLPASSQLDPYIVDVINKLVMPAVNVRYQNAAEAMRDLELGLIRQQAKADDGYMYEIPSKLDFSGLEQMLNQQEYKSADLETWNLICAALNKPKRSRLSESDIAIMPCNELLNLDRVWLRSTGGKFGFSVKCEIYEAEGSDYKSFCDRIGYRFKRGERMVWLDSTKVDYTDNAPKGHLPWVAGFYGSSGAIGQEGIISILAETLKSCRAKLSRFGVIRIS